MKRIPALLFILLFYVAGAHAQQLRSGLWKAALQRADGNDIVFNFDLSYEQQLPVIRIRNAEERLEVRQVKVERDSVFIDMPFFESHFKLQLQADGSLRGNWIKATSTGKDIVMPFTARHGKEPRFPQGRAPAADISGRWDMEIIRPAGGTRPAIAELKQDGSKLTGTILTPSGDYRFLEGVVSGDSMFLSTFDGSHAYVFSAHIGNDQTINGGYFYSGPLHKEAFSAKKNANAKLDYGNVSIFVKPGQDKLNFRFPDIDGNHVGIKDDKFKNKVVVIQLMGSWCPNCMDETNFLSNYYRNNKQRGIEMVALAYEYSTDLERSRKSLRKFQQRFNVEYPILITPVTSSDTLRTVKTLPQLTAIKVFPSTIFLGKDGRVAKVHSGFYGPATGERYTEYIREFEETVKSLLAE